jgi:hypothetical protein
MTGMGFEPTITVFERAKTVYALERAASVTGFLMEYESSENVSGFK